MMRPALLACILALVLPAQHVFARPAFPAPPIRAAQASKRYSPAIKGFVAGFRMAGIEPDGDPIDQVVLQTKLAPAGVTPAANLIVDAYLENFTPDTTPILPDLLHPNQTAQNLGGFLQGKVLLTDDAGNVLYIGSFLAEAFLNSTHHAVMRLYGSNTAYGGKGTLKGTFQVKRDGTLKGSLTGSITLPRAARQDLLTHRGDHMKPLKQIISVVTVHPAPMMGKATHGTAGAPLHTGYPTPAPQSAAVVRTPSSGGRQFSPWTIASATGMVISFFLAGVLFWTQRKKTVLPHPDDTQP